MVNMLILLSINSSVFFHLSVDWFVCLIGLPVSQSLSRCIYLHLIFLLDVTHNTAEGQSIIKETKLVSVLSSLKNGK